jgi:hypothetical protein
MLFCIFSGVCKTFNPGQDDVGSVEEVCSDVLTSGMKNPGQGSISPTFHEHLLRQNCCAKKNTNLKCKFKNFGMKKTHVKCW